MKIITNQSINFPYPNLTMENQSELQNLLEELSLPILGKRVIAENLTWPTIDPNGSGGGVGVCIRSILAISGDKSSFYKERWKSAHTLEEAGVYLLDYYEHCKQITKLGVLLTDVWRPSTLSRWGHIYEMYENKGIQSVALLCSGHQITPVRWPWR